MINVVNFFPSSAKRHFSDQEQAFLGFKNLSSALVMDLPLRYIFQYALNHVQEENTEKVSVLGPYSRNQRRTALIVTESKTRLQEWMRQEQRLYETPESDEMKQQIREKLGNDTTENAHQTTAKVNSINPWQHLSPPTGGSDVQDEFISTTQTQTQSQAQLSQMQVDQEHQQQSSSRESIARVVDADVGTFNNKDMEVDTFQSELWSRIQIRYAPTIHHLHSLFRCLHLGSESTQGRTFGYDGGAYSPTIDDNGDMQDDSHLVPTLILLIGCFQGQENNDRTAQSKPSLCVLPSHISGSRSLSESRLPDSATAFVTSSMQQSQLASQQQQSQSPFLSHQLAMQASSYQTSLRPDDLDRERVQYIKTVGEAMSEIKDSLEWLERASGQNVGLLVFENSVDPNILIDSSLQNPQTPKLPSPRELWLQKVLGQYSQEMLGEGETSMIDVSRIQSSKDALKLWLKTHHSTYSMLFGGTFDFNETSAASAGAVVGLRWNFDISELCFNFNVIS
ncbi:hypothetical protein BGZ49_005203 [Haplosporangium sp. Z 27]|nr:hypothetical protein BGZ49_005203 [Haplosporangium sp. Z 27]